MKLLPGSTVPAVSRTLEDPFAFLISHTESTFPSRDITTKGDVPVPNVEMLEVADSLKMLSAITVTAGVINVVTGNVHKVGNSPKKPAARKLRAKKSGEKQDLSLLKYRLGGK
jgi:hypothetical protein